MGDERQSAAGNLRELLHNVKHAMVRDIGGLGIGAVTSDSRAVIPGALFVAIAGGTVDGHDYVNDAIARGAAALVLGKGRCLPRAGKKGPACIEVADTREALGLIAAAFWQEPAKRMIMIGITGTNGKTTSTYLLETLIREAGGRPGVIGTVNYRYEGKVMPAPHTTPAPEVLQQLLREMADSGVSHVIMEVSSHALEQRRVAGVSFDVALFTNLSREHLDFHGDMETYYASKKRLFEEHLKPGGTAVVIDAVAGDPWGKKLLADLAAGRRVKGKQAPGSILRCGVGEGEVALLSMQEEITGLRLEVAIPQGEIHIQSGLVGDFNIRNLLGVVAVGAALGFAPAVIEAALSRAQGAPGRLERVESTSGIRVFVDYAHTPDALENVLTALRHLARERLIVVFGCGGDRDRGKRPLMGAIAGRLADVVVLTSDNPRSEPPESIISAIEHGVQEVRMPRMLLGALKQRRSERGYDVIPSRKSAIRAAIWHANQGDIVVISGKGHEDYQIIGGQRFQFDDRMVAREMLQVVHW